MPRSKKSVPVDTKVQDILKPQIPISALALRNSKAIVLASTLAAVVIMAVPSAYFYNKYRTAQKLLSSPAVLGKKEVDYLVEQVGKLIELPTSEVPTVASVTDINKLKDQSFFVHAQNGDKVLIYAQNKKAFLYRPTTNKIIEVGPVNIQPTGQPAEPNPSLAVQPNISPNPLVSVSPTTSISPTVTIAADKKISILNGTMTSGLTKKVADNLTAGIEGITVVNRGNAQKRDYAKTLVIDISGNSSKKAEEIARYLSGETAPLPEGEPKPEADILIIAAE